MLAFLGAQNGRLHVQDAGRATLNEPLEAVADARVSSARKRRYEINEDGCDRSPVSSDMLALYSLYQLGLTRRFRSALQVGRPFWVMFWREL